MLILSSKIQIHQQIKDISVSHWLQVLCDLRIERTTCQEETKNGGRKDTKKERLKERMKYVKK